MSQPIEYRWRGPLTDAEMVALVTAHGGRAAPGWWDQIRPHSLGWVTARQPDILGDRHAYGVEATRAAPLDQSGAQPDAADRTSTD